MSLGSHPLAAHGHTSRGRERSTAHVITRARQMLGAGHLDAAAAALAAVADPTADTLLAQVRVAQDAPHEAIRLAERAVDRDPGSWQALAQLAYVQSIIGAGDLAQATARAAVHRWASSGARRVAPNLRRNVVMLHCGRCGSTVLADLLAQHFELDWDGEIFTETHRFPPHENPISFLLQCVGDSMSSMYGIEIKSRQDEIHRIDLDFLFALLDELAFSKTVFLRRRNLVRRLVSSDIAATTNQWHARVRDRLEARPVHISVAPGEDGIRCRLEREARALRRIERVLQTRPHLALHYEDDVMDDPMRGYTMVRDYLELTPLRRVEVRLRRTNPVPVSAMVSNFAELAQALAGTRFEAMLHD